MPRSFFQLAHCPSWETDRLISIWHPRVAALLNAASIAGLMITTEALVSEIKEEERSGGGGGGPGMGGMY